MTTRRLLFIAVTSLALGTSARAQPPAERSAKIQQKLDEIIFPVVQFQKATIEEALEYLRIKSRDLDTSSTPSAEKGITVVIKETSTAPITIDLRDVSLGIALKYCAELAGLKHRVEPYAVVVAADFKEAYSAPPVLGNADKIIFPTVQFSGATLEEAAEFFRIKSRDLDPSKKGVNILIKTGGASVKISLDLRNIPLSEALNYAAQLSGCQLTVDSNIYVLSPSNTR